MNRGAFVIAYRPCLEHLLELSAIASAVLAHEHDRAQRNGDMAALDRAADRLVRLNLVRDELHTLLEETQP